ncbi:MAG: hypothetical protein U9R47_07100 [Actinomycetota bacterium]|nr:hypothetical protein [Actinomycetota bacterium]
MYHQHDFVKAHVDAVAERIRHDRHWSAAGRRSPSEPGSIRSLIARVLVLAGARVHGSTPAVIGNRVVLLDPCRDDDLRLAA